MKNINDFNMDFFSLKGKNAIVTGGVSGLGQAFALALAKAGANIFVFAAVDDDGTICIYAGRYYRRRNL